MAGTREPETRAFEMGKAFDLEPGDTGKGPGLTIWYSSIGYDADDKPSPTFSIAEGGRPIWSTAGRGRGNEPLTCGLLGERTITLLRLGPGREPRVTLVVSKASPRKVGAAGELLVEPLEFSRLDDGTIVTFAEHRRSPDGSEALQLRLRRAQSEDDESVVVALRPGKKPLGIASWREHLVAVDEVPSGGVARGHPARVRMWLPARARRPFAFGKPVTLYPGETAVGPTGGEPLVLHFSGFGHRLRMDRSDSPFAELEVTIGDKEESLRLWFEGSETPSASVGPYAIRVLDADPGPPHGPDSVLTLEVRRR